MVLSCHLLAAPPPPALQWNSDLRAHQMPPRMSHQHRKLTRVQAETHHVLPRPRPPTTCVPCLVLTAGVLLGPVSTRRAPAPHSVTPRAAPRGASRRLLPLTQLPPPRRRSPARPASSRDWMGQRRLTGPVLQACPSRSLHRRLQSRVSGPGHRARTQSEGASGT